MRCARRTQRPAPPLHACPTAPLLSSALPALPASPCLGPTGLHDAPAHSRGQDGRRLCVRRPCTGRAVRRSGGGGAAGRAVQLLPQRCGRAAQALCCAAVLRVRAALPTQGPPLPSALAPTALPAEIRALGFAYRPDAVTGFVPNPDYVPPPPPAAPRRPPPPPPPLARLREIILTHAGMAAPPPPPPATQPSPRSKQGLLLQLQQRRQAQRPAAISTAAGATPPASQQGRSSARPRWLVYAQIALLLGAVAGLLRCARRRAQRALPSRRRLQFQPGLPLHANGNGKANGGKAPVSPLH